MTTLALQSPQLRAPRTVRRAIPHVSAEMIADHARRASTRQRLIAALERLDNDECDLGRIERFRETLNPEADQIDLLDNAAIAHSAAELIAPSRALEIGVRRGFTTCAIVAAANAIEMHMLDSWRPVYSECPNPGPELVHDQLLAVGHRGKELFHEGNSHDLLPMLNIEAPHRRFDIIVVDGDHTEKGAEQDLADAFPLVAPRGVLVFDDLVHPSHPYLLDVWRRCARYLKNQFDFAEYIDEGLGVGWAVRR